MLIILACAAGVWLGLNFTVLVLVPGFVAAAAIEFMFFGHQSASQTLLDLLAIGLSLQCGFMIGLTGRDLFVQLKAKLNPAQSKRV